MYNDNIKLYVLVKLLYECCVLQCMKECNSPLSMNSLCFFGFLYVKLYESNCPLSMNSLCSFGFLCVKHCCPQRIIISEN